MKLTERNPMSDATKEAMRQFVVVTRFAMTSGLIRRYGRGGGLKSKFNLTKFGIAEFLLTHDQVQVCKARALEELEEIDRLDRQRQTTRKRSKRYDWEYLDQTLKTAA